MSAEKQHTCHYCDAPAVAFCDYAVMGDRRKAYASCDRPICAKHGKLVGHVCDRSRRTKNNLSDTIDYCAEHAGMPDPRNEPPLPDDCEEW